MSEVGKFCPECGTKNSMNTNFCGNCGTNLSGSQQSIHNQPSMSGEGPQGPIPQSPVQYQTGRPLGLTDTQNGKATIGFGIVALVGLVSIGFLTWVGIIGAVFSYNKHTKVVNLFHGSQSGMLEDRFLGGTNPQFQQDPDSLGWIAKFLAVAILAFVGLVILALAVLTGYL